MANPFRFLLRVPVPWVFILVYLVGAVLERVLPSGVLGDHRHASTVAGVVLVGVGAAIAGWGLGIFWKARTTTVPGQASAQLVMRGPYRFTRNPMYVGLTLVYLGEAGLMKQVWPIVVLPLMLAYLNWIVIPVEEAKLGEVFGDQYDGYRGRVRRWI